MRQVWLGVILAFAVAAAGGRAQALSTLSFQSVAVTAPDGKSPAGRIYCGPDSVLTLSGEGEASVRQASELAQRLQGLAEEGLQPQEITLRKERKARVLLARGERLLVVDKALALAQRSTVDKLATTWLENLRAQFGKPHLAMQPLIVPLGEARTVPLKGRIVGAVKIKIEPAMGKATWNASQRTISMTGQTLGRGALVVEDRASRLRVPVQIMKYAAQVKEPLTAVVTGDPASVDAIEAAVRAALDADVTPEPGATSEVGAWVRDTQPLALGASTAVPVAITATGEGYLDYRMRPVVRVANKPMSLSDASRLLVSNSPERLRSTGLWYEATLDSDEAARLLYHHVNASEGSAVLALELWNLGEKPARVHVTSGIAGPSSDEAWVGHRATVQFLQNRKQHSGWILTVPAGTAVAAVSQSMPRGSVVSGVLELRALGEAHLSVRILLRPPETARGARPIDQYRASGSLGMFQYPDPVRRVSTRYQVGGHWAFITIGDQPAVGTLDGDQLSGSYGVFYDITVELSNPTEAPTEVLLAMEAAGGPARGALLVDGRIIEVAMLKRDDEVSVLHYLLGPGQTRTIKILIMPEAGSNYPVRLVMRPL
jgi:hypothetical protein